MRSDINLRYNMDNTLDTNIHEYGEEEGVVIGQLNPEEGEKWKKWMSSRNFKGHQERRWVILALNEGGACSTEVDLVDLLKFVKEKMPDVWNGV